MSSALTIVIWILSLVSMVMLLIVSTKLIYRLRDKYPAIYVSVGRPSALSRNVNFLWRLKAYEDQLSPADIKLLRLNLALVYIFAAVAFVFVVYVISQTFVFPVR